MAYVISDSVTLGTIAFNGASVSAYKASRFGGVPAEGTAPPGAADAGPVTTGPSFGAEGSFQITLPTVEDYYLAVTINGVTAWKLYPSGDSLLPTDVVTTDTPNTFTATQTFPAASIPESVITNLTSDLAGKVAQNQDFIDLKNPTYGVKGDGVFFTDAAMTSGSNTISTTTTVIPSGITGKTVSILGAGANGSNLWGTATYVNSTSFTISGPAATTTVSGARCCYGTDDTAAIDAAINALTVWSVLVIPSGQYLYNGTGINGPGHTSNIGYPRVVSFGAADAAVLWLGPGVAFVNSQTTTKTGTATAADATSLTDGAASETASAVVGNEVTGPDVYGILTVVSNAGTSVGVVASNTGTKWTLTSAGWTNATPSGGTITYTLVRPAALGGLHWENVSWRGGFGAIRLTSTVSASGTFEKRVLKFNGFGSNGAHISSLSLDDPHWQIDGLLAYQPTLPSTGIGVALAGYVDECHINVRCQNLRVNYKLGRGGDNAKLTGGWVPSGATWAYPRIAIWIVPEIVATNSGSGLDITQYRFGPESYNGDTRGAQYSDHRLLYADSDTSSGIDGIGVAGITVPTFATQLPSWTASTGFITGHNLHDSAVYGAGPSPAGPVVYSTTPNVRGCHWSGLLALTRPNYIVQFLTPPGPDYTAVTNTIGPWVSVDTTTAYNAGLPSNGNGFVVIDPAGMFSRASLAAPLVPTGGQTTVGLVKHITATPTSVLGSATQTAATDSLGGSDAVEVTYTSASNSPQDALSGVIPLANVVVGMPMFVEFDIKPGSSASLVEMNLQLKYGGSTIHNSRNYPVPASGWVRHRLLHVPRESSANLQVNFYATTNDTFNGKVQIGRVRVYQAREPQPDVPPVTSVTAGSGKIVVGGTATAPTVDVGTGIPESAITNLSTDLAAKAPLASPTFTGTVTVPTSVNATDAAQRSDVTGTKTTVVPFTSGGTTTVPAGVSLAWIKVKAGGGGGGGGGAATGTTLQAGGGGGGAGGNFEGLVAVTAGHTLTAVVGAAGSAGNGGTAPGGAGTDGGDGGDSTLTDTTASTLIARAAGGSRGKASLGNSTALAGGGVSSRNNTVTTTQSTPGTGGFSAATSGGPLAGVLGGGGGGAATATLGGGGGLSLDGQLNSTSGISAASGNSTGVAGTAGTANTGSGGGAGGGGAAGTGNGGAAGAGGTGYVEVRWVY